MDSIRQKITSTSDYEKGVFVINDVDLNIPPTNIEVRKEDLVYNYRTLRTKSSTKIPTGNGQVSMNITIPFTTDLLLSMHRLIVQIRNSPFAYIDNRYIRESIVPDWPSTQNMAMTITGISISNMPNASNAFTMQLDGLWFNYFPYMHNYTYRNDWTTDWILSGDQSNKYTIGWYINPDTYEKKPISNIVASEKKTSATKPWSLLESEYNTSHNRTIYEMEARHPGIEFDLSPLPDNMAPSEWVYQAKNSNIYVRYINYLQRDALLKNFGISVESDLFSYDAAHGTDYYSSCFKVPVNSDDRMLGLHSSAIPKEVRNKWIRMMLKQNHGIRFRFHAYKEIRLPQKITDNIENRKNQAIAHLYETLQLLKSTSTSPEDAKNGDEITIPLFKAKYPITSDYGWRTLNNGKTGEPIKDFHSGLDIGGNAGKYIYAPESGTITQIKYQPDNTYKEGPEGRKGYGNVVYYKTDDNYTWVFGHLQQAVPNNGNPLKKNQTPIRIEKGDIIGIVGNSGYSTGAHLHLEYRDSNGEAIDPGPKLRSLLAQDSAFNMEQDQEEESYYDYTESSPLMVSNQVEIDPEDQPKLDIRKVAINQTKENFALTEEEASALGELMDILVADGWSYYDKDTTVVNTWEKEITVEVANTGYNMTQLLSEQPEEFINSGIVLTGISASLSHLVAKIPILSHEFPTSQHLGSTEPEYQIEFAVLDDRTDLEGSSEGGQLIQAMRSLTQSNARKFRNVVDGWCISTDTFITRLLGSYEEGDYKISDDGAYADLKKRTLVNNSYDATVDGNPGLSVLMLNMQETNPYVRENLVAAAPSLQDKDSSRQEVIDRLYNLKLSPKYADQLTVLLLNGMLNTNSSVSISGASTTFSMSTAPSMTSPYVADIEAGVPQSVIVKANTPSDIEFYRQLGLNVTPYQDGLLKIESSGFSDYIVDTKETSYIESKTYRDTREYNVEKSNTYIFDVSRILTENPELVDYDFTSLLNYYQAIKAVKIAGSKMLAESESGGLVEGNIQQELYGLPVQPNMWKSWQYYISEWIGKEKDNSLTASFVNNPNYPYVNKAQWKGQLTSEEKKDIVDTVNLGWGLFGTSSVSTVINYANPSDIFEKTYSEIKTFTSEYDHADALYETRIVPAQRSLVSKYLAGFQYDFQASELLKTKFASLLGSVLGDPFATGTGLGPEFQPFSDSLFMNIDSCGNIDNYLNRSNVPIWVTSRDEAIAGAAAIGTVISGGSGFNPLFAVPAFALDIANGLPGSKANNAFVQHATIHKAPGSPFEYPVTPDNEQIKLKYLKNLVASIADDILGNYKILLMLGLEKLQVVENTKDYSGMECYPDLDLPWHPYYGTKDQVYPDFYMWNIYEDGRALSPEMLQSMYEKTYHVVENCYDSLQRLSIGDRYDPRTDSLQPETDIDNSLMLSTEISPEGTDNLKQDQVLGEGSQVVVSRTGRDVYSASVKEPTRHSMGPSSSPFAQVKDAKDSEDQWNKAAKARGYDSIASTKPGDFIKGIKLANAEGVYGTGSGVHYPSRASVGEYESLKKQLSETEDLFGSKEGYLLKQNGKNYTEPKNLEGTNLERPPETAHTFDKDNLKRLAKDSTKDIASYKMSLRRAFPTIKMYFIEEDEYETRFVNFDDFYSYNAIKECSIVMSRDNPADTAVLTVQNISGTLDGTRRDTVTDLDYFSKDAKDRLAAAGDTESSLVSGNPSTTNTSAEQPFGAVVLRPGLNVQLRAGYSNDPDQLHVMLNGRIVDVTWNITGDLAEVTIQSFGTELAQVIKGTARDGGIRTFDSTHELLGSMMLEPEVVHFGRWEFGQTFQIDEAKDFRLDFRDYAQDGYLGKFAVTKWVSQFMFDHTYIILGAALFGTLTTLLPVGGFRKIPWVGNKIANILKGTGAFNPFGLGAIEGSTGMRIVVEDIAKSSLKTTTVAGTDVLDDVAAAALLSRAGSLVNPISEQALVKQGLLSRAGSAGLGLLGIPTSVLEAGAVAETKAYLASLQTALQSAVKAGTSIDDAVKALTAYEEGVAQTVVASRWMSRPGMEITKATFRTAVGTRPLGVFVEYSVGAPVKLASRLLLSSLAVDLIVDTFNSYIAPYTTRAFSRFYNRNIVRMFLTPQDDNLYPPHPKDYMTLDPSLSRTIADLLGNNISILTTGDNNAYQGLRRFVNPDLYISKRVSPDAVKYQPVTTTIWRIFKEMSIRHPGWVYGPRPYGREFRYTMFFGLPSQRYWARGGTNAFIYRANKLRSFLDTISNDTEINKTEYINLYGEEAYNTLVDYWTSQQEQPVPTSSASELNYTDPAPQSIDYSVSSPQTRDIINQAMASQTIKEYLRALEIRFEPYRRYHMFSSERDIVWNGITGSESSVINAVDVTYAGNDTDDIFSPQGGIQTAIFKAHAFIPEQKLRIAPVRWDNCKGYSMAMRYGMGELLERTKYMYRGEIVVLGNARIRPWDIAILYDTYNDMVGPIEVDQVVHTISHETGWLTEVKPCAVTFANEISGWPMVEAMKLFSMAVLDVEKNYKIALSGNTFDSGIFGSTSNLLNNSEWFRYPGTAGPKLESFLTSKYNNIFGTDGSTISDMLSKLPDVSPLENTVNAAREAKDFAVQALTIGSAISAIAGGAILGKAIYKKSSPLIAGGLGVIALGGDVTATALDSFDFPSAAFLFGGTVLFMQCLRNDAVMLVPLMKSGNPIVAGMALNDPSLVWNNFKGVLSRAASDTIEGTVDLISLYKKYGSEIWSKIDLDTSRLLSDSNDSVDLTGG